MQRKRDGFALAAAGNAIIIYSSRAPSRAVNDAVDGTHSMTASLSPPPLSR